MANCQRPETFTLLDGVVGAEFCGVEFLLMAAFSKVLKVSATHLVAAMCECGWLLSLNEWLTREFEFESLER